MTDCCKCFGLCSGGLLLAADYCQLELRIFAHLCADPKLSSVLNTTGVDVFNMIAAEMKSVDVDHVTTEFRQQAKQVSLHTHTHIHIHIHHPPTRYRTNALSTSCKSNVWISCMVNDLIKTQSFFRLKYLGEKMVREFKCLLMFLLALMIDW